MSLKKIIKDVTYAESCIEVIEWFREHYNGHSKTYRRHRWEVSLRKYLRPSRFEEIIRKAGGRRERGFSWGDPSERADHRYIMRIRGIRITFLAKLGWCNWQIIRTEKRD